MNVSSQYDVLILGGGPAGLATALSLKQHQPTATVAVVEPFSYRGSRSTEVFAPICKKYLERLGILEEFLSLNSVSPSHGIAAAWGSKDLCHQPYPKRGWNVDRPQFDAWLAEMAIQRGVDWLDHDCRNGDFIVDATGRHAVYAWQQGATREVDDLLIGHTRIYRRKRSDLQATIEAWEHGWWNAVPHLDDKVAVTCYCEIAQAEKVQAQWNRLLEQAQHIEKLVHGSPVSSFARSVATGCLDQLVGKSWLAVGDAACSLDPVSGLGMSKVLQSGIFASYAILDHWSGRSEGLLKYQDILRKNYEEYQRLQGAYYAREQRWCHSSFWQERHRRSSAWT